jgi:aspartyl protease family protein
MRIVSIATACLAASLPAIAVDVNVIGLFPGKAVVVIDRGAPRTLSVGDTVGGVKLLSADSNAAVLEVEGRRETLSMGQHFEAAAQTASRSSVTLAPDARGHYLADGQVNGAHVRFLVDTGATMVSLPAAEATRLGIDYRRGQRGMSQTAAGPSPVYRVMLDSVTVGDVTVLNVEGLVHEAAGLDVALLGMSFLNRMEMRRDGTNLVLVKRY